MNESLILNNHGLRLITQYEGAPRLTARLCEGGRFELSYGCTFHLDGRPVEEGETCDEVQAMAMFRHAIGVFEEAVRSGVTVPLNENQFSALVSFCYNVGAANFASSSVLRHLNQNRYDDAADSFGMWIFATKDGHKQALRGLLRRRYSEACLFMGFDWTEACANDAIALQKEAPSSLPGSDLVIYKTSFRDVLTVAHRYPITDDMLFDATPVAGAVTPAPQASQPKAQGPAAPIPSTSPASVVPSPAVAEKQASTVAPASSPAAPVGTKPKSANTVAPAEVPYRIDANAGLKPLDESDRAKGYWYQQFGIVIIRLGSFGVFGTGVASVSQKVQSDAAISNMVLTGFVLVGVAATGYIIKKFGDWKRKRGEKNATQALY